MAVAEPALTVEEKLLYSIFGKPKKRLKPKPVSEARMAELSQRVQDTLNTLTPREREIIELRYGLGDGKTYTLDEVAKKFNITRDRVRQAEAKAVRKMHTPDVVRRLDAMGKKLRASNKKKAK